MAYKEEELNDLLGLEKTQETFKNLISPTELPEDVKNLPELPFTQRMMLAGKKDVTGEIGYLKEKYGEKNVEAKTDQRGKVISIKVHDPITGQDYVKNNPNIWSAGDVAEYAGTALLETVPSIALNYIPGYKALKTIAKVGANVLANAIGSGASQAADILTTGKSKITPGERFTDVGLNVGTGAAFDTARLLYKGGKSVLGKLSSTASKKLSPIEESIEQAAKETVAMTPEQAINGQYVPVSEKVNEGLKAQEKLNRIIQESESELKPQFDLGLAELTQSPTLVGQQINAVRQSQEAMNELHKRTSKNMLAMDASGDSLLKKLGGGKAPVDEEKIGNSLQDLYTEKYLKELSDDTKKMAEEYASKIKELSGDEPVYNLTNFENVLNKWKNEIVTPSPEGPFEQNFAKQQLEYLEDMLRSNNKVQIAKKLATGTKPGAELVYEGAKETSEPSTRKATIMQLQNMLHKFGREAGYSNPLLQFLSPTDRKRLVKELSASLYKDLDIATEATEGMPKEVAGLLKEFRSTYKYYKEAEEAGHVLFLDKIARQAGASDFANLPNRFLASNVSDETIRNVMKIAEKYDKEAAQQVKQSVMSEMFDKSLKMAPSWHPNKSFISPMDIVNFDATHDKRLKAIFNNDEYKDWNTFITVAKRLVTEAPQQANTQPLMRSLAPISRVSAGANAAIAAASSQLETMSNPEEFVKAMFDENQRKRLVKLATSKKLPIAQTIKLIEGIVGHGSRIAGAAEKDIAMKRSNYYIQRPDENQDKQAMINDLLGL
jgi:hypothetical protein